ncbi:hypothetical protein KAFR_0J01990 [Kazachstania africana CBS 2517]|uniref:t-SNARE coiled-coil homology domain-containing protein n=1 Tax=Kazachstania africana (strain ATCC 22294 / BCRC 22015 / CBS 2517 / CECT 1963 / NBRC 1671 / NRRL Y-8276) TaxID=1071382 RepID=H2B0W3_KAZAF|nr:hypothetical protein KAFR_0J01990 [Kazachstania africana CBS 2517]CCF60263.1 hypothetical protein KAFR_0J01990 [Kazachstania africana CBS 2517]
MSFYDVEAQSSAKKSQSHFAGDERIGKLITSFTDNLKTFEREFKKFNKLRTVQTKTAIENELIPTCSTLRDEILQLNISNDHKLYGDFTILNNIFLNLIKNYNFIKERPIENESSYITIQVNESEQTPLLSQQQSQVQEQEEPVLQEELDFQTIIQQERNEQAKNIHSAVNEVNAIFKQLGTLVTEQGVQINTIDDNINQFSDNAMNANKQLNKANEHQKSKNKCGTVTLIIIVIVTLVVLLAVLS